MSPVIEHMRSGLQRRTAEVPRPAGDPERFLITTPAIDAYGDSVQPEGIDLTTYRRLGMPLFYAHDISGDTASAGLPIGNLKGLEVTPQGVWATGIRWAKNDPFVDRVKNLWDQGMVRGFSIGFIPIRWRDNPETPAGKIITESRLMEVSLVNLPANPDTIRARSAPQSLDPAAFTDSIITAVLAAQRRVLADRAWRADGARSVSVTELTSMIRDAFASARRS